MTIADHIGLGLGLGLGLVTALGGPGLRNGGPSEWRTLTVCYSFAVSVNTTKVEDVQVINNSTTIPNSIHRGIRASAEYGSLERVIVIKH